MHGIRVEEGKKAGRARQLMLQNALVFLVHGKEGGREAWAYIMVRREKLPLLMRANTQGGRMDLNTLGESIAAGWGKEPPHDVQAQMKTEYGV